MDIHDRSTYTSNLESLSIDRTAPLHTDNPTTSFAGQTTTLTDSSQLSPAAQALAQAMQMPEVRQDRIASLQQQIASGNYHVAAQDVADAMLRNLPE